MTPEQINIKIAEACGWRHAPEDVEEYPWQDREGEAYKRPPDYYGDLNACHEMEKSLTANQCEVYDKLLLQQKGDMGWVSSSYAWNATAPQRCEAFLRALGLWEDA